MSTRLRSKNPRITTYPKYPKISPEAPTVSSLLDWKNQTARPLATATMSDTTRNRATDRYAARTPSTNSGTELPSMCCQEKCRNGALRMSGSLLRCCGRMPKSVSRRYPSATLNTCKIQISARNALITITASRSLRNVISAAPLWSARHGGGRSRPGEHPDRVLSHRAYVAKYRGAQCSVHDLSLIHISEP